MEQLDRHIEALIFASPEVIDQSQIKQILEEFFDSIFDLSLIEEGISRLKARYDSEEYAFELVEIGGGFRFMTKPIFERTLALYLSKENSKKLSTSALETLSIIAYKQPITKTQMEQIRGVNCDYTVSKLLEKEFICIVGRSEDVGRPLIYGTSTKFMDYFGLRSMKDLPQLKDFSDAKSSIGGEGDILESASE